MGSGVIPLHWLQVSYDSNEEVWENVSWSSSENLNVSKYDDLSAVTPYITRNRLDSLNPLSDIALDLLTEFNVLPIKTSAAKLGLITGLALSLVFNSKFHIIKLLQQSKFQHWFRAMVLQFIFAVASLIFAIIVAPFVGVFIIILMCYKQGVHFYLKMTQPQYVQLFEGLDAIWAVEEETSRSIINVLAFIEVEDVEEGSNLLNSFRKTIVNRLITPPIPCAKLLYLRQQFLGYFYWEKQTDFKIEDYVRPMVTIPLDCGSIRCKNSEFPHRISEETLKYIVGEFSNSTLPKDHTACWEILVGTQPINKSSVVSLPDSLETKPSNSQKVFPEKKLQYPVMFRIHHSLGDGIALMKLLVSVMNDIPFPSASLVTPCMHSQKLPPIPMPARKFQPSNNSSLQIKGCRKMGECPINMQQTQVPSKLKINELKIMTGEIHHPEGHTNAIEISTDIQDIEENKTVIFCNNKKDESEIILKSVPSCSHMETISATMKCIERPLFLENCNESLDQVEKSSVHEKSNSKSERNTQVISNQIPCPTPQPIPKFKTFSRETKDSYNKISASYNKPLTTLPISKLSPSLNSNFQTSLPALNLCQTPKRKSVIQKLSQNTTEPHSINYILENDISNLHQNTKCQSTTQTGISLEEPSSLCRKPKSIGSYPTTKSTYKLPTNLSCSKNMTLHCYKHSMSESYINIPEDLVCSRIESRDKYNSSSTIYYYSSTSSPMVPTPPKILNTEKIVKSLTNTENLPLQTSIKSNRCVSPLSNEQISFLSDVSSSLESGFEDININAAQTMSTVSSPFFMMKSTPNNIGKCIIQNTNYLKCNIAENEDRAESRKTKSEGELNKMLKFCTPGFQESTDTKGKYNNKNRILNDNLILPNILNDLNVTNQSKKEGGVTLDIEEEQHSQQWFRRLRSESNKLRNYFKGSACKDANNTAAISVVQSDDSNQCVQLLNTISTCRMRKPERFSQIIQTIYVLALSPASLIHQVFTKATDRNVLHGPPLTGHKVIAWHRDPNGELFNCLKNVKNCFNTRFTEVFLTALSASLDTYFETHQGSCNNGIPESVNVVIPARMEQLKYNTTEKINMTPTIIRKDKTQQQKHSLDYGIPEEDTIKSSKNKASSNISTAETWNSSRRKEREVKMKGKDCNRTIFDLNNRFSVAMLQLPVSQAALRNYEEYNRFSAERRLNAVCHNSELLRKSLDYQVNYWLLKVVASYLTKTMLTAVVRNSPSTLVVSNIMGPTQELSFAGSKLQDIMFWVPHRGTTGIGITVLSYMGHLQIGIMADKAVIHCKEDAQMILDGIVVEMNKLETASSQPTTNTQGIV